MTQGAESDRPKRYFHSTRTALWHLRHGGPIQLGRHLQRRRIPTTNATASVTTTELVPSSEKSKNSPASKTTEKKPTSPHKTVTFPEIELPKNWKKTFSDITVATILDDFSELAFGYEWNQIPLSRQDWITQIDLHKPDLLFVESAWHGNNDQWQYQLTGTSGVKEPFKELMQEFKKRNIPTVFWNKEDPPHYEDFLECAALFDFVFTTDIRRVDHYRKDLGHDRIGVMGFAAQPAIHGPARPSRGFHERDVAFGGMYFSHKFPERRKQMNILLGGAKDVSHKMNQGLEIFSRYLGDDQRYQFPSPFNKSVVGSLNYRQMLTAYQAYKVFLSVSSVADSPSMCPRRVFEILSKGTAVVSGCSQAITQYFPHDELPTAPDRNSAADIIRALVQSPEFADRMVRKAQRRIWREHTYSQRAAQVIEAALGTPRTIGHAEKVSVILCTNRPQNLHSAFQTIGAQLEINLELVLVCHGLSIDDLYLKELAASEGILNFKIVHAPRDWTLGECFNAGVQESTGDVISKMDDDDWYGPHYLHDQLAILRVTGADIVGKNASYLYIKSYDVTILRFGHLEHRWTDFVLGPTIMAHRQIFEAIPFEARAQGEDSAFLRSAVKAGYRIYASDRFNFRQYRGGAGHTWAVDDQHILSTGVVTSMGDWLEHIRL